ncbi:MAG: CoA activase [Deltaproteobacteria bacterium]|nr:CoA activase [Deltaproteobacteria bacterium]
MEPLYLGIDVGSVSANTVIINRAGDILEEYYTRLRGQPLKKVEGVLEEILSRIPGERFEGIAFTGTGGKGLAELLGGEFYNEIIAQSKAIGRLYPQVRTIIDIGGEDSKLIILEMEGDRFRIEDFSMNTLCAAGTGSFLDQQASRLGLTIEEFAQLALKSQNPPRIAGRCSVFAKTDMIHLQQIATPDYDIVAGLCYALARNFKSNIGKGREFRPPVAFQGGVAANAGMKRAFLDILELQGDELIIPQHYASMGAIGAVLLALEEGRFEGKVFEGIGRLQVYIDQQRDIKREGREPLTLSPRHLEEKERVYKPKAQNGKIPAYLGLDVGSISTNLVVIDEEERVLAKSYLMTAGRPIEAIRQGLQEIGEEVGDLVDIQGAGSTGSGRYLTGDFVGADIVRNEITAQATAAANIDPEVDTIFEIGGQDSKYVSLDKGVIVDFDMNKVCAAGTGSFLEEQAEKLGISIKGEFEERALRAPSPVRMGERCTVFIESDLVHHQQRGAGTDDLVAGLCYSIVQNYLNRVVGDRRIGNKIFFQGGTAFNKGVVAAFEKVLGKEVTVPENHDVTGAIGVALLAKKERTWEKSSFKGFDLSQRHYEITTFECKGCPNMCLIRKVSIEGEKPLFYGSRCEKYDVVRRSKGSHLPDLFAEREELLLGPYPGDETLGDDVPIIGIPRALLSHELFPFWKAFFTELGYRVVLSDPTNKELIRRGVEAVVAETCFPVKVAHGHVMNLLEKGIKRIFLPSIISMEKFREDFEQSQTCPYVQSLPYTVHSSIDFKRYGAQVLQPVIPFGMGSKEVEQALIKLGRRLKRGARDIRRAYARAQEYQNRFYQAIAARGKEILEGLREGEKLMVIVGRPYNSCDPGLNLDIPKKLRDLGVLSIPMDFLPLESMAGQEGLKDMYWKYGQKILAAAHLIKDDPRLFGVYISNFGCGADSFINHFFRDILNGKPYLQLEIDEHSADAGAITRCEAFLDSLKHAQGPKEEKRRRGEIRGDATRTIYIPYMCDHAFAFVAAFEACGLSARVFPESDQETLYWGRKYTTGRECYPCILTTGDMIRVVKGPDFDPQRVAFFMPSGNGPCRFGQYHRLHRLILDELGYADVPIYSPNQDETLYKELGILGSEFDKLGWWAIVAVDLLIKKLHETRPYEQNTGETDRVYKECLDLVCEAIRTGGGELERLEEALREVRERFERILVVDPGSKPKIGVVGEIYVRSNRFANEHVVRKIEALGGEAWLAPFVEWIHYINAMARRRSFNRKHFSNLLRIFLTEYYQNKYEHRLERIFKGSINNLEEPKTAEVLELAKPYLDSSFEGEAILSIGKTVDFALRGASGVVNVMPFTCMPGTVVSAILKRYREENNNLPVLNMAYDGQEQSNIMTRLEAFMYQTRQYQEHCLRRR